MATLVRDWSIGELHQRRHCVACEAPGARPARPVVAMGSSFEKLDDYVPWMPLCADCARRQLDASRTLGRRALLTALLPSAAALLAAVAIPSQQPWPIAAAAVVAVPLALRLLRHFARRAAVPALVVGGQGSTLRAHLDVPDAAASSRDAAERVPDFSGARPLLAGLTVLGLGLAWAAWSAANPEVLFDNPSYAAAYFTVDGLSYSLTPDERAMLRLHVGAHRVVLSRAEGPELVPAATTWGQSLVVVVSEDGCFGVGGARASAVDDIRHAARAACDGRR